jgi:hypothetical protein
MKVGVTSLLGTKRTSRRTRRMSAVRGSTDPGSDAARGPEMTRSGPSNWEMLDNTVEASYIAGFW